jgi:hypothetical protein
MAPKKETEQPKTGEETKVGTTETTKEEAEQTQTDETSTEKATKPKKKFYKRVWFWIVVAVAALVLIGATVFFVVRASQQGKNKQIISQGWHELALETNNVVVLSEKITNQESYNEYSKELHKLDNLIDDKEFAAQKLAGSYEDAQKYKSFLTDYNRYITDSARFSDNVANYTNADNDQLKDLSDTAKEAASSLKSTATYLTEDLNQKIFATQDVLTKSRDEIVAAQQAVKAQQAASAAQQQTDSKNLATVEQNTAVFENAFIAGDAAKMRQYMTPAFQNEYNFEQLKPENRQYTYPASYRIISTKKNDDGTYSVKVNILYKSHTDSNQYTVGNELSFVNSAGSWLVNSIREGSGY